MKWKRSTIYFSADLNSKLGTPSTDDWPEIVNFPYLKNKFPALPKDSLKKQFGRIDDDGLDLLAKLLTFDPSKRITAKSALAHVVQ